MKRMRRLALLAGLLAAILAAGGCGGSALRASDLLLERESINRVQVHREQQGLPAAEVAEPGPIEELLALLDGVEVQQLSRAEDAQFLQNGRRLQEQGIYRVTLGGSGNLADRGYFIIFAGGDVYMADPQTFKETGLTISYRSLGPQKELYNWLKALPMQETETPGQEEDAGPSVSYQVGDLESLPVQSRSPDGGTLALFWEGGDGSGEGKIYLWRPPAEPVPVAAEWRVHTLEWSADGRYVLSQAGSSALSAVKIIAAAENKVIEDFPALKAIWSPDGQGVAVARPHPGVKPSVEIELDATLDLALYRVAAGRWEILATGSEDYYYMPVRWTPGGILLYEKISFTGSPRETGQILPLPPGEQAAGVDSASLLAAMVHVTLAPEEEVKWMELCTNAFLFRTFTRNSAMDEKALIHDLGYYLLFRYHGADRDQMIDLSGEYPVIKKEALDRLSQELFGRKIGKHQSVEGFDYKNGQYTAGGVDDHGFKTAHIQKFADNKDGTYTVDYDYYYVNEGDVNQIVMLKPEEFIDEIHREPDKFPKPFASGRLLLRKVMEDGQERYIILENGKSVAAR